MRIRMVLILGALILGCSSDADSSTSPSTAAPASSQPESSTTSLPEASSTTEQPVETTAPSSTEPESATPVAAAPVFGPPATLEPDCATLGNVAVGLATGSVSSGGNEYTYQLTVPSTYERNPLAVVLDFHGIGSNGAQQALLSGWAAKAEAEGFLAVQPTGISVGDDERASWELPQFESDARDDVQMVVDLLEHISQTICIDPARVYATGMSNGGLFTSTLICRMGERLAAAVSVAGVTHHETCDPSRAVPYLAFHGTADTTVPYDGDGESTLAGADEATEFFEQVMPDEFGEFANDFGCATSEDSEVAPDVIATTYSGCEGEVPLAFYTVNGGGHTWPGSPISAAIESLGFTTMEINATELSWDFFSRHSLRPETE